MLDYTSIKQLAKQIGRSVEDKRDKADAIQAVEDVLSQLKG